MQAGSVTEYAEIRPLPVKGDRFDRRPAIRRDIRACYRSPGDARLFYAVREGAFEPPVSLACYCVDRVGRDGNPLFFSSNGNSAGHPRGTNKANL